MRDQHVNYCNANTDYYRAKGSAAIVVLQLNIVQSTNNNNNTHKRTHAHTHVYMAHARVVEVRNTISDHT